MNLSLTRSEVLILEKALETHTNELLDSEKIHPDILAAHTELIASIEHKIQYMRRRDDLRKQRMNKKR